MIALIDGMPLIELEDGDVVAFDRAWLLRTVARAAGRAGYQKWWLAEHVVGSVSAYLSLRFSGSIVTLEQLHIAIRSALETIGYAEVAPHLELGAPGAALSLEGLAREVGSGYELLFFRLLDRRLQAYLARGTTFFELVDLAPCVKLLQARKVWTRQCETLRDEIVAFVRNRIATREIGGESVVIRVY